MHKFFTGILVILLIIGSLSGCGKSGSTSSSGSKTREKIIVGGTGANQELLRILAAEFMKTNSSTEIDVPESIGTGGGITEVTAGRIDIARVTRPLKDAEKKEGLVYREFALTPIVFASSTDVTSVNLNTDDVIGIYSGKITNWEELGGNPHAIMVIGREPGDSSLSVIEKAIGSFFYNTDRVIISTTDQDMILNLREKEGAIGFGTLSNLKKAGLHVFSLDSRDPLAADYPLIGKFGFIYRENSLKAGAKAFIDFVCGTEGSKIIAREFCKPVR